MENKECSLQDLIAKAERYCASCEHCAFEVAQKIRTWGGKQEQVQPILDHLYDYRFLDDERYCRAYVHDKFLYQHWGKVKIQAMLSARQLPSSAIRAALQTIDEEQYLRTLQSLATNKKASSRDAKIRFLLQRGFAYSDILKIDFGD